MLDFALEAGYVEEKDSKMKKIQKFAARLNELRMRRLPGGYYFEQYGDRSQGSRWRVVRDAGN